MIISVLTKLLIAYAMGVFVFTIIQMAEGYDLFTAI